MGKRPENEYVDSYVKLQDGKIHEGHMPYRSIQHGGWPTTLLHSSYGDAMMPFAGVTTLRHVCTLGRTMDFPPWLLTDHLQSEYESKMSRISRCACQGFPNSLSFQLPIPKKLELAGSVPEFSHVFPRKTQPNWKTLLPSHRGPWPNTLAYGFRSASPGRTTCRGPRGRISQLTRGWKLHYPLVI